MYTEGLVREGKQSRRIYQVHNSISLFWEKKNYIESGSKKKPSRMT